MSDLRAIANAATPGPWVDQEPGPNDPGAGTRWIDTHAYSDGPEPVMAPDYVPSAEDAAHIAAWSPDRALAALDAVGALLDLLEDTQHAEHDCGDVDCPVTRAIAALARWEALA